MSGSERDAPGRGPRLRLLGPEPRPGLRPARRARRGPRPRPRRRRGDARSPRRARTRDRGDPRRRRRSTPWRSPLPRCSTPPSPRSRSRPASTSSSRSRSRSTSPTPSGAATRPRPRGACSWSATSSSTTRRSSRSRGAGARRRARPARVPVLEPAQPRPVPPRGEHPLELRPPRHLDDPGPGRRRSRSHVDAVGSFPLHRDIADVTTTHLDVPRRRAGPRVRVVAAPVQGAEARRRRRPGHGGLRRRRAVGVEARRLPAPGRLARRPARAGARRRRGRPRSRPASRSSTSAATSSSASRPARRRAPTAARVCGCCACSRPPSRPSRRSGHPRRGAGAGECAEHRGRDDPRERVRRRAERDRRGHADLALQPRPRGQPHRRATAPSARTS